MSRPRRIKGTFPVTLEGLESMMRKHAKEGDQIALAFLLVVKDLRDTKDELEGLHRTVGGLRDRLRRLTRGDD